MSRQQASEQRAEPPAVPVVSRLYLRLAVSDAAAAIDFYVAALAATEVARYTSPDGKVVHAEITIGGAAVVVKDENPGDPAPTTLGGTPVLIALDVDDNVDALGERMVRAGATVVYPISDQPYGRRGGRLTDPFGHQWMISQRIEDLSPDEIQRRIREISET